MRTLTLGALLFLSATLYDLMKWFALPSDMRDLLLFVVELALGFFLLCSDKLALLGVVNWSTRIAAMLYFLCGIAFVRQKGAPPLQLQYLHMAAACALSSLVVVTVAQTVLVVSHGHKPHPYLSIAVSLASGLLGAGLFAASGERWVF